MEDQDAIDYLNNLERGMFCTVNIPIYNNEKIAVTAMYMGKDKDGRYNFLDTGRFILSKNFIENQPISIEKEYDEDKAFEIYSKVHRENPIKAKKEKER